MIPDHVKIENIFTYRILCISRGRNERDPAIQRLLLFESFLFPLTNLLHLEHPLHNKFVLTFLIGMTLILTLPREEKLGRPTLIERNEEMCTLVAVRYRDFLVHHLLPCGYHRLAGSQLHLPIRHHSPQTLILLIVVCWLVCKDVAEIAPLFSLPPSWWLFRRSNPIFAHGWSVPDPDLVLIGLSTNPRLPVH